MTLTKWMNRSSLAAVLRSRRRPRPVGLDRLGRRSDPSPALKAVQGVWVSNDDAEVDAKWTVENDKITATVNGVDYIGKLKLDSEAKPHPVLDDRDHRRPRRGQGKGAKGVYKLEGEKLVVNISHPGGDRPKDFDPDGDQIYLFELKKEKKG